MLSKTCLAQAGGATGRGAAIRLSEPASASVDEAARPYGMFFRLNARKTRAI
jgi:hypothetical protein